MIGEFSYYRSCERMSRWKYKWIPYIMSSIWNSNEREKVDLIIQAKVLNSVSQHLKSLPWEKLDDIVFEIITAIETKYTDRFPNLSLIEFYPGRVDDSKWIVLKWGMFIQSKYIKSNT